MGILGCASEQSQEERMDALWLDIIRPKEKDEVLVPAWCEELEGLARQQPERYADYLIGANAMASANSQTYDEWTGPLGRGLEDLERYEEHLSVAKTFYTKVSILYEDARLHDSKGLVGLAESKYQKVWKSLPAQHPDSTRLLAFRNALPISLAQLSLFQGDYKQAEYWLDQLWDQLDVGHPFYPGLAYSTRAQVEQAKGKDEQAIEFYKTSIQYFLDNRRKTIPGHYMETCMHFAEFLRKKGDFDQALQVILAASKQELKGERHAIYRAYQMAKIYLSQGELDEAFQQITQALSLSKEVTHEEYYWHAKILAVQAEIEFAQQEYTLAVRTAQLGLDQLNAADLSTNIQTSPDPREIESKLDALPLLITKARALSKEQLRQDQPSFEPLILALQTFTRAIELIQILRAEYKDDEVKEFLSSSSFMLFEPAINTAYRLYTETKEFEYLRQGLKIAETSRSLSLLENLRGHQAQAILGIPAEVLAEENSLKYQISRLENEVKLLSDPNWKTEQRQLLSSRRETYQKWQEKIQKQYPAYYELKYQEEPIDLEAIQSSLSTNEAVLSFFWGEENIYGILISHDQTSFQRIPLSNSLNTAIQQFSTQISSRRGGNSSTKLERLVTAGHTIYKEVLMPFGTLPERLILVTDGPLHYIPLAALPTAIVSTESPKAIPYLIEKHIIKRIFSVAVWLRHIRSQHTEIAQNGPKAIDTLLVLAPAKFPDDSQLSLDSVQLKAVFGEKVHLVREVNTERAKALLQRNYKYVLIFSHASAGGGRPYIQLSADSLYLEEIYHTDMGTNFIVLGACESGIGMDRKGEGLLSIGRAFIYQNVSDAAMTLWKVQDAPALKITQSLLQHHIQDGLDPAEALRTAQLSFLRSPDASGLPYQWAGFVAIGQ
ncbi:MAG: CHAT domain-containing protein [Saprospiraceae bacterium]|nr:CHAT domain-containing protein [Saprospiraceae bacterium]